MTHAGCHFCSPIQVAIDADTQRYPVITQRHMQVAGEAEVAALEAENARLKQVLSATAAGTLSRPPYSNPWLQPTLDPNPDQVLQAARAEHFAMRSAARPASAEAVAEEQAVEEAMAAEAAEVQRQAASVAETVAEAVAEAAEERAEAERQAVAVDANGEVTLPTLSPLSPPTSAGGAFSPKVGGSQASQDWWRKFRQAEAAWEARQPGYVLTDEERRAEMIAVSIPMGAGAVSQASPCGGQHPCGPRG